MRLGIPFVRNAEIETSDNRFLGLLTSAIERIPRASPPIVTLRRVELKRRGRLPGVVGLTTWGEPSGRGAKNGIQTITYYTDLLGQLSGDAAIGVIVHELAHAWLNEHLFPEDSPEREAGADELARRWGFGRELDVLDLETEPV